jgi:hypothetical protein
MRNQLLRQCVGWYSILFVFVKGVGGGNAHKKSVSSHFMFYRVAGRAVNGCVCCSRFSVNINFDRSRVSDKKYIQKTYLSIYFLCGIEYNTAMDMVHLSCQKGWGQWCNYHIGLKCHLRIMY